MNKMLSLIRIAFVWLFAIVGIIVVLYSMYMAIVMMSMAGPICGGLGMTLISIADFIQRL